ncbi:hypothetical protein AUP68_15725 [Ilyonectria robusta]
MLPMKAISGHIATEWDADSKFKTVQKIVRRTEECELENVSEVSWNARVHELLLEIALEPFGKSISHWDVTKAPMNKLYLPRHGSGSDLQAKMVDFYICLGGNSTTAAIRHRLKKAGDCYSINHSPYQPLRYRPIAISIETKTPDGSGQEAKTQVSVWAAAYMARLRALSGTSKSAMALGVTLPLVTAGAWGHSCGCAEARVRPKTQLPGSTERAREVTGQPAK